MQLLAPDWQEQIAEEQKKRSSALMRAIEGPDYRAVDDSLYLCDQLVEIRRLAVLLADRTGQTEATNEHEAGMA